MVKRTLSHEEYAHNHRDILKVIIEENMCSSKEIQETTEEDRRKVWSILQQLCERGILKSTGSGKNRRYLSTFSGQRLYYKITTGSPYSLIDRTFILEKINDFKDTHTPWWKKTVLLDEMEQFLQTRPISPEIKAQFIHFLYTIIFNTYEHKEVRKLARKAYINIYRVFLVELPENTEWMSAKPEPPMAISKEVEGDKHLSSIETLFAIIRTLPSVNEERTIYNQEPFGIDFDKEILRLAEVVFAEYYNNNSLPERHVNYFIDCYIDNIEPVSGFFFYGFLERLILMNNNSQKIKKKLREKQSSIEDLEKNRRIREAIQKIEALGFG